MDKYYEALGWINHKHRGTTVDETHPLAIIGEALEKARKFDQLVEARKKATPGEWCKESCHIKIPTKTYIESNENAEFIALAANLTREDTK